MNETSRGSRVLRSVAAVLAGMAAIVVLSIATDALMHTTGIFPSDGKQMGHGQYVLATIYRTAYSILGSYIAARLAPARHMGHALAVGVVGLLVSLAGIVALWEKLDQMGPRWYPIALVVIALPAAWIGGKLRLMQRRATALE
jgi:hypothetical protein